MPGNWRSGAKVPFVWAAAFWFRLITEAISNLIAAFGGLGAVDAANAAPWAAGSARLASGVTPSAGSINSPLKEASVRALLFCWLTLLAKIFMTNPALLVSGVTLKFGGIVAYTAAAKLQFCVTELPPSL